MRKLLSLLVLPGVLLVGCTTWKPNEKDYLHMVEATDPVYNDNHKDSTLLNRGYAACHMLEAGLPEAYVLQQVPSDRDPGQWSKEVNYAKAFLCPEVLKKEQNAR
jgi:hypothetical protein